ncbi:M23 family metallopeptidase [Borrelia sp. RT1S]|uniref:M23 family metallopeptidase n=1 Tax=Borrelia sp. RT1S TaxID=2898580 RepID=UPI001E3A5190|nr:peptidoglycan DD-metalloendopeptidase family protein [Borrelia sp. RT1S]UGQ17060.1 peptidoglycan DD-metalloendopeptidase family protein [Borrelia sp. RT1S]
MFIVKSFLLMFVIPFNLSAVRDDVVKDYYEREVFQGEVTYFASNKNFKKMSLLSKNKNPILSSYPFKFEVANKTYYVALLGITPMIKEGMREIEIEFENGKYIKEIEIKKFEFRKTTVELDKKKAKIFKRQKSVKAKEQALILWNIIGNTGDTSIYHYDTLVHPIKDQYRISSPYGDQRVYIQDNKKISSLTMHKGKDYASFKKEKTPIFAAGRGKIVFAKDREITGKTVIIQHLPGVYTIYLHLSKFGVKEDKIVHTGEYIGNVGSTGISTGPHLHFEVRVNGVAVNPDFFLNHMLIDKNKIINHIEKVR